MRALGMAQGVARGAHSVVVEDRPGAWHPDADVDGED
jgi:hypothetical protein